MWIAVKALLLRWVLGRSVGGLLSALFFFAVPIAGILKIIGLPVLIVLAIVALPALLVLAAIGLPILMVVATVSVLTAVVGTVLAASVALLKIAVPIILAVIAARWIFRKVRSSGSKPGPTAGAEPGSEPAA